MGLTNLLQQHNGDRRTRVRRLSAKTYQLPANKLSPPFFSLKRSVQIVPPPSDLGSSTSAAPITQPTFTGAGKLLDQADCRSTSFSLVSADNLIVYAAIVGCMADRPECCPWSVSVGGSSTMAENGGKRVVDMPDQLPMSASSVLTGHPDCCSSAGAENKGDRVAGGPGRFPTPANSVQARLSRCPDDYYSVSGQCCPNGFYRFTRQIAFQTPCFSGAAQRITPPLLTAGLAKNPTDTSLPTSAIVNFILAMGFNVSADHTPPLTESVAIGVGVGAGVFGLVMISLTVWLIFRVRRSKRRAGVASAQPVEHPYHDTVGTAYPQGYGTPSIASPPGSPQSPGQIGPHAHARQFSNSSVGSGWTSKSPQGEEAYGYPLQVFQPPQPHPGHYQQPQQGSPQYGHPQVQPPPQPQGGYGGYHERG